MDWRGIRGVPKTWGMSLSKSTLPIRLHTVNRKFFPIKIFDIFVDTSWKLEDSQLTEFQFAW